MGGDCEGRWEVIVSSNTTCNMNSELYCMLSACMHTLLLRTFVYNKIHKHATQKGIRGSEPVERR